MNVLNPELLFRILALCVLLAAVETLHGIARTVWLAPRLGKARALRWSIVTGALLATGVCAWQVPGLGLHGFAPHLALGVVLALLMAGFDLAMGMLVLRRSLARALEDFDPRTGNLLLLGLFWLALAPALVWWGLRG
ncbi:hypothetical protein EDC62_1815 [Tibeticola sediminis]|uniref:Uncharacterized protein n=1 Tax=Tibeticola sediminis TaxID=1917811 RepID=A0A3N4U7M7_9BURK|nr:hypothetical protein [Tibeticola sediminis]RPE66743.1 hypothetical protein EDC62_1815 [Tibeticola sediminis]